MKIGIIGYGVVGKAIYSTFKNYYQVYKYDKFLVEDSFDIICKCDFVFISVPTPYNNVQGRVDDSAILESLENLNNNNFKGIIIIKSTVPPGSSQFYNKKYTLKIVFNPEFLRESKNPNKDFAEQHTVVIGSNEGEYYDPVKDIFESVLPEESKFYSVSYETAELIKYSQNMTLASRVAVANLVYDACQEFGVDYEILKKIAFDSFEILGPHMVEVPGPDGERGFGGKCLPKDTMGFNSIFKSKILGEILEYNKTLRDDLGGNDE